MARLATEPDLEFLDGPHAIVHWRQRRLFQAGMAKVFLILYHSLGNPVPMVTIMAESRLKRKSVRSMISRIRVALRDANIPFDVAWDSDSYSLLRRP